ncbi:DUF2786 domain-containing protein [Actinokineospora sp. G85]|uniref:DUF2786 domain-containing protein n=1 Tax=Actinokineospora sp. G85 TaxID=3406626 RepID=UPI003C76C60D
MRTHERTTAGSRGSIAVLAARLTEAAVVLAGGDRRSVAAAVRDVADRGLAAAGAAATMALAHSLELLWGRGWLPADVAAVAPKRVRALLLDAIAHESARHAPAALHPLWRAQLADLGIPGREQAEFTDESLDLAVELLAALMVLPQLPRLVQPPGSATTTDPGPGGVDRRVLARVRALLAKAESTAYPDEAEALSAKAQELMARHAFERAVLDADHPHPPTAGARRLWLTGPYQTPRAQLVAAIAQANRCRSVFYAKLGCVAVVGHETDLEIVEVLTASLQLQATQALRHTPTPDRTRAFRHAFLTGYAHRIHTRLTTATTYATSGDTRLVPVLTTRQQAVDLKFATLFPHIRTHRPSISNTTGWTAGHTAATLADLTPPRPRIAG